MVNLPAKKTRQLDQRQILTFLYKNPDKKKIFDVIKQWQGKKFKKDDQLFIFFSGHGDFDKVIDKGFFVAHGHKISREEDKIQWKT
ncbi:MAG: caspase family protein [Lewinellaceae bacterium]|nr:caspase family protein [Phaeodactylibacter sp.]MCB9041272.1 caspase family protein [Lewinellaceae bacterium]